MSPTHVGQNYILLHYFIINLYICLNKKRKEKGNKMQTITTRDILQTKKTF